MGMSIGRRSFLARLITSPDAARVAASERLRPSQKTNWQPASHATDDWLDQVPGKHRLFFDAQSAQGARQTQVFATNYYAVSHRSYGLRDDELAVVFCLRHWATPFGYGDPVWAKFGQILADSIKLNDARGDRPTQNPLRSSFESLADRGARIVVCEMSTRGLANEIAHRTGGQAADVHREMSANTIKGVRLVPAGIIAVNRAQERGYSIAYAG